MTAPAVKTDTHAITPVPSYGVGIYEIINKRTGHIVDRVQGLAAAQAAQAKYDAYVMRTGQ